jgi:hypothetical protein
MRPVAPALPHGCLAQRSEAQRGVPYDLVVPGVPRRSCRVVACSEREARILGAVELGVELELVRVRPEPYSLVAGDR